MTVNNIYNRIVTARTFYPLYWFALASLVGYVDYVTGLKVQFPIWFIMPVVLAAWFNGKWLGLFFAVSLPVVRFSYHFFWHEQLTVPEAALNAVLRITVLVLFVFLIDRIVRQSRKLKRELKVLKGILPICSGCKRIKNDAGEYEPLEKYLTEHSEADFSHGLCKECAKKLYPDYFSEEANP